VACNARTRAATSRRGEELAEEEEEEEEKTDSRSAAECFSSKEGEGGGDCNGEDMIAALADSRMLLYELPPMRVDLRGCMLDVVSSLLVEKLIMLLAR
jgi:hypothetical protein